MVAPHLPWIASDEFLDQEELSETKHMDYAGIVAGMAGGTLEHCRLATNLIGRLFAALEGRDCAVFGTSV